MSDFDGVFADLRPLLARHESALAVVRDEPDDYQLETTRNTPSGTRMWFGAVQMRTSYVSFHLMPVYSHPVLLDGASDELRKRMQGRSCFNFTRSTLTPELVDELSALVDAGLARYRADKLA